MSQVFPLVDKHFNPVYSRKVLEALIAKAGGSLQSVQKFHSNRDESLAYYRAKITAESESDPREPEYKPKRCVLVPLHLIKGFTDDWKPPTPPDTPDTPTPPSSDSPHNDSVYKPVTSSVTPVTANNSQLHEKCNQQDVDPVLDSAISDSPVTSFLDHSIDLNHQNQDAIANALGDKRNCHTLTPQKNVTEEDFEPESLIDTEAERLHKSYDQGVTDCNQETKDVTEEVAQADAPAPSVEQTASTLVTTPDTPALVTNVASLIDSSVITVGDIVQFMNPDDLPRSRQFENLDLRVLELIGGSVAECQLPDGQKQTFGLCTLRKLDAPTPAETDKVALASDDVTPIKLGDRVLVNPWPHTDRLGPYSVERIEGDFAKVEGFEHLVPLSELRRV
jgi:hypothetical protein